MTLKQLVEAYDGQIVFNVLQATLGGREEVIDFSSEDINAIKDDILAQNVQNFTVEVTNNVRATARITVVLEATTTTTPPSSGTSGSGTP